jgi:hypothetical protein
LWFIGCGGVDNLDVGKTARPLEKSDNLLGNNRAGNLDRVDVGKINKNTDSIQFLYTNRFDRVDVGKIPFGFGISLPLEKSIPFGHTRMLFTPLLRVTAVFLSPAASAQDLSLSVQSVLLNTGAVGPSGTLFLAFSFGTEMLRTDTNGWISRRRAVAARIGQKLISAMSAFPLSSHGRLPPP